MIVPIDESQRKAARVAGFSSLLAMPFVVFANFAIHDRLIVAGNTAETAWNILAHERLFRISIACDLIYCAGPAKTSAVSLRLSGPEDLINRRGRGGFRRGPPLNPSWFLFLPSPSSNICSPGESNEIVSINPDFTVIELLKSCP